MATHTHTIDTGTTPGARPLDMRITGQRTFTMERALRLLGGTVVTTSVLLGLLVHPYWFGLTLFAGLNLFQSALTNRCPAVPLLRKLGVR